MLNIKFEMHDVIIPEEIIRIALIVTYRVVSRSVL